MENKKPNGKFFIIFLILVTFIGFGCAVTIINGTIFAINNILSLNLLKKLFSFLQILNLIIFFISIYFLKYKLKKYYYIYFISIAFLMIISVINCFFI